MENLKHDLASNCKFRTINLTLNPAEFSFLTLTLRQRISSHQNSTTTTTTTSREKFYIQSHETFLKLPKLTMLKPCKYSGILEPTDENSIIFFSESVIEFLQKKGEWKDKIFAPLLL
jgi:hypothetical protein